MTEPASAAPARCEWASASELMQEYHDTEWGVALREDRKLFEYFLLDAFQAGLSWHIVLKKREAFRSAFHNFEPSRVAAMNEFEIEALTSDSTIIRNRAKITATVENARCFLAVQEEYGSFWQYLWAFVDGTAIQNAWTTWNDIPAQTDKSRAISNDLKKCGFRFVGPTIVYAVMQSAGLVNDHVVGCPRRVEVTTVNPA